MSQSEKNLSKTKEDRIDLRVDEKSKEVIERAATLSGMSVSAFILFHSLKSAKHEIEFHERITLSARDRNHFLAVLSDPPAPNAALKSAMAKHRKKHG